VSADACRFFRHIHQYLPAITRVLAWNQTRPCSNVTTMLKFSFFAKNNNGRACFRDNAFNFGDTLTGF